MKKAVPAWMVALRDDWRAYLLAFLSLFLIWGVASFGWGSINAWAKRKANQELYTALAIATPPVKAWLGMPLEPLAALVADPLLQTLPHMPLGLASPAAQRWMDIQTSKPEWRDVVLTDFATGRTLMALGNTPPPPEMLAQMAVLDKHNTGAPRVLASGRSNAMLYYGMALPEASATVVILPRSLRQLAGFAPKVAVPVSITVTLNMPHANGQVARWNPTDPMRLETVPDTEVAAPMFLSQLKKVNGFAGVTMQAEWIEPYPPAPVLAFVAIGVWGVLMSIVVLWRWLKPVVAWSNQKLSPVLGPVGKGVNAARAKMAAPMGKVNAMLASVGNAAKHVALQMKAILAKIFPLWAKSNLKKDPNNWRRSGTDESSEALTDGPGGFVPRDFSGAVAAGNPSVAVPMSPLKVATLKPLGSEHKAPIKPKLNTDKRALDEVFAEDDEEVLIMRIVRCMNEGLVELLYQPMYDVRTGSVYANEVLARLADNQGQISPAEFLPVLGSMGKLSELDALVFEKVIATHFHDKVSPIPLSLNVSGNSLEDLGYLREIAAQGPTILQHFIFEVRSNEVVRDPNALKLLKTLQRQGARVAIDYFGGGAGMVQATKAIGLDVIKADTKRVVDKMGKKDLLEMCLAAAKLKVPVVLEKVEDSRMEDFAKRAGVQYVQGYSLGKPLSTLTTLPLSAKMS